MWSGQILTLLITRNLVSFEESFWFQYIGSPPAIPENDGAWELLYVTNSWETLEERPRQSTTTALSDVPPWKWYHQARNQFLTTLMLSSNANLSSVCLQRSKNQWQSSLALDVFRKTKDSQGRISRLVRDVLISTSYLYLFAAIRPFMLTSN